MAVETDGSRFAAGAWETLKRGISSLGVSTRAIGRHHASPLRSASPSWPSPCARLRAAHRPLRSPDLRADRALRHPDPGPAHHLRQHLRPGHPAGRHLLSEPIPRLVDRCERESLRAQGEIIAAAIAASASVETRPHRARSRPAAGDRRHQSPFRDDAFAALQLSIPPERVAAYPAATRAGGGYARARLRPRWDAHRRYCPAAVAGSMRRRAGPPAPGSAPSSRTGGRASSVG